MTASSPAPHWSKWRPPAPFEAHVHYLMGGEAPDPLWLTGPTTFADPLGRKVFIGYGPAGKPVRPDGQVVGVPPWATVIVAQALNRDGVPAFAVASTLMQ